jgi:hypothetical protein
VATGCHSWTLLWQPVATGGSSTLGALQHAVARHHVTVLYWLNMPDSASRVCWQCNHCTELKVTPPKTVLEAVYPEQTWLPWLMSKAPNGMWDDKPTVEQYMQWLGEDRLGFTCMEDWCRITVHDFNDNNGAGLLAKYKGSPIAVLQAAYPQHAWQPHRFRRVGYSAVAIRWLSKHESTCVHLGWLIPSGSPTSHPPDLAYPQLVQILCFPPNPMHR